MLGLCHQQLDDNYTMILNRRHNKQQFSTGLLAILLIFIQTLPQCQTYISRVLQRYSRKAYEPTMTSNCHIKCVPYYSLFYAGGFRNVTRYIFLTE